MDQLLWIGCLESDEEFEIKARKGSKLASAQVSQKNIVDGIQKISGKAMDSINGSVLPPFPVYKDKYVRPVEWSGYKDSYNISVGYKNIQYINRLTCKKSMLKAVDNWINNRYDGKDLTVLVYSMRSAPMAAACRIKKKIPNAKIYLIITDLPCFMDLSPSRLKVLLKKIDWISIKRMKKKFDGFILYASKMSDFLNLQPDKWILMEGSYHVTQTKKAADGQSKKTAFMYSGNLNLQYGIEMLMEAFMQIEDDTVELWLTGGGNAEEYIKQCAQKDSRIKFYGFLPSRNHLLELQSKATALVNMRLPSEPASSYCFPSKLLEYMASAKPVISFNLEGIPEEYEDYLVTVREETAQSLKASMMHVLSMSDAERKDIGEKARRFIVQNKNSDVQARKIYDFIK